MSARHFYVTSIALLSCCLVNYITASGLSISTVLYCGTILLQGKRLVKINLKPLLTKVCYCNIISILQDYWLSIYLQAVCQLLIIFYPFYSSKAILFPYYIQNGAS